MITHLEHYAEQDGDVIPLYDGDNAPHFKHPEDVGHVATLDVIDTDDYPEAVEADERAAALRAAEAGTKYRLADPELNEVWLISRVIAEDEASDEAKRRKEGRPTIAEQNENAAAFDRQHAPLEVKQIMPSYRPRNSKRTKTTSTQKAQKAGKAEKADKSGQLQLIG